MTNVTHGPGDRARVFLFLVICLLAMAAPRPAWSGPEDLEVISSGLVTVRFDPARRATAREVAGIAPSSMQRIAAALGMKSPRGPVRVYLPAPGDEPWSQGTLPDWVSGYARPDLGLIVLVWGREPRYPDRSIQSLLDHELAHILLHRAAVGRALPRWFDEGAAMLLAREWAFQDSWLSSVGVVLHGDLSLSRLSGMFTRSGSQSRVAYALSYSLVRYLTDQYGPGILEEIVRRVGSGKPFDSAFLEATGHPLEQVEARWRRNARLRYRWIPLATSTTTLWIMVTVLFLVVYLRKRRLDRQVHEAWEQEEQGPDSRIM